MLVKRIFHRLVILGEILYGSAPLPRKKRENGGMFELGVRRIVCLPWEATTAISGLGCWQTLAKQAGNGGER